MSATQKKTKPMKFLPKLFLIAGLISSFLSIGIATTPAYAAGNCNERFLTFPTWYRGLTKGGDCALKQPSDLTGVKEEEQIASYISIIVLNVLEIILQLVVYIAAGFIIWGGFMYLISGGSSDRISSGRKMIQNAVVGLVISIVSTVAVSFIAGRLVNNSTATINGQQINVPVDSADNILLHGLDILYFVVGMVAVITIIIAGIQYAVSNGDSGKVKTAKDAILYAVVGIIVIMLAFTITGFVLGRFSI